MDKLKFTFKTEKATGRYRSFGSDYHYIKLKGKVVGAIYMDDDDRYYPAFQVMKTEADLAKPNDNKNCSWKWIYFKQRADTLDGMKEFIKNEVQGILERNNLTLFIGD